MIVVSNTSPLNYLVLIGEIELLPIFRRLGAATVELNADLVIVGFHFVPPNLQTENGVDA